MKTPKGFLFAGLHAGIKPQRKDLSLVFSPTPCAMAGCFTVNKAKAAPILDAEPRLPAEGMHAVLTNSGNANALTGPSGVEDVQAVIAALAKELKVPPASVVTASTGVIGVRLPAHKLIAAAPRIVAALGPDAEPAAEAIMTTDTRMKVAARTLELGGRVVTLSAIAKGSGMIAPQLATMIAVVATDCDIAAEPLAQALRASMDTSFNNLTVDQDMSTNDVVFALANGLAANPRIEGPGADLARFEAALRDLCEELAKEIATDGEGATKRLEIKVTGAPTRAIASDLARSIAGSNLVKAAIFGADPNWGRVLATVGARAGSQGYAAVNPYRASVHIQGIQVYDQQPMAQPPGALRARMREPEVEVVVELRAGAEAATAWGCDLSYDYVKINADYTSLIVQTPEGGVAKDDRLANYSPSFKQSLLVEALTYISRFRGKRCVIACGGAAMAKETLKHSFCRDVNLLRSVGLVPIVVHGGGAELHRTLEKLGSKPEFIDGIRFTNAADQKVMEMVLSGSINAELVTLLNRDGGHAVGVSGKDGALLRARRQVRGDGKDPGQLGEITGVNKDFLELLLQQGYLPVISPVGLGEGGEGFHLDPDAVAAEVASALGASKLIHLADLPGFLTEGALVSELTSAQLEERRAAGLTGDEALRAAAILRALSAGVQQVHVIDGRTPHNLIAELLTDRGVGTLVTAG